MSHNTLLHRLVRPVVARLAATALRPNHLTGLRIATAIGAALCFGIATASSIRLGAALFALSALLDRADGELARLTRRFSRLGHRLDLAADLSADALAFLAMGYGARHGWLHGWAPVLGAVATASTAVMFLYNNRPGRPATPTAPRLLDPDDLILVVPVLACLAGLPPVLLLAGIISPLAAICVVLVGVSSARTLQRPGALPLNPTKAWRTTCSFLKERTKELLSTGTPT